MGNKFRARSDNGQQPAQGRRARLSSAATDGRLSEGHNRDHGPGTPRDEPQDPGGEQRSGGGTRGSQAAVSFSVLVVFLLLELGHQAEFPAAAAFGKIQCHILWWKARNMRIRPQATRA